jgi:hypothetical protein
MLPTAWTFLHQGLSAGGRGSGTRLAAALVKGAGLCAAWLLLWLAGLLLWLLWGAFVVSRGWLLP